MGMDPQDADEKRAVSATDVYDPAERREVVRCRDRHRGECGEVGHGSVEVRGLFRSPGRIVERIVETSLAKHRFPGSHTVLELLPRVLNPLPGEEHDHRAHAPGYARAQ